ncbi:MAG TPA: acyltransferase [Candidatus Alistipes intestinigallinarum]|uniref:Acyltransferase n=1 Tax=Candidatus Alistipes intestinigallinarum TaxID=2838440 RepID=A0A9D1Z0N3_9BACT|nr:acyltransferase [Candidatus Alistipes intestinigallinarum]
MITTDDIFRLQPGDAAAFEAAALALFRFQSEACPPYREYLRRIGIRPEAVGQFREIPFLPIELFKSHEVYCGETPPEEVFTSSATTGMIPSRHPMRSLALYERAFRGAFRTFYGDPARWSLYALLPNYLRRKGSSLVYMADRLIADCGSGGFYLDDCDALLRDMAADPKPKILLGVSYALWDLAERYVPKLHDTVVMETGGMKGYREEIPKEEFHRILCDAFGVEAIHSEYGMAELTSQAYSQGGNRFRCPAWMRVVCRDVNDPFEPLPAGSRGGLNIVDLANLWSCAFIQTQDVGQVAADGSFVVEGRIDHAEIRGCNLLVQ